MKGWQTDRPPIEEPIFCVVETNGGPQYFVGAIDTQGDLVDLEFGDDYGWEFDTIDRWISLSDLDALLESHWDNPPDQGEKGE